jgi:hypothetical protein
MGETIPRKGSKSLIGIGWRTASVINANTSAPPNSPRYPKPMEMAEETRTTITNQTRERVPPYTSYRVIISPRPPNTIQTMS